MLRTDHSRARAPLFIGVLLTLALVSPLAGRKPPLAPVSALICELRDGEPEQKREAARKLGALGAAAREAIPALTKALNDPEVCFDAHQALKRVSPKAPETAPAQRNQCPDCGACPDAKSVPPGCGDLPGRNRALRMLPPGQAFSSLRI